MTDQISTGSTGPQTAPASATEGHRTLAGTQVGDLAAEVMKDIVTRDKDANRPSTRDNIVPTDEDLEGDTLSEDTDEEAPEAEGRTFREKVNGKWLEIPEADYREAARKGLASDDIIDKAKAYAESNKAQWAEKVGELKQKYTHVKQMEDGLNQSFKWMTEGNWDELVDEMEDHGYEREGVVKGLIKFMLKEHEFDTSPDQVKQEIIRARAVAAEARKRAKALDRDSADYNSMKEEREFAAMKRDVPAAFAELGLKFTQLRLQNMIKLVTAHHQAKGEKMPYVEALKRVHHYMESNMIVDPDDAPPPVEKPAPKRKPAPAQQKSQEPKKAMRMNEWKDRKSVV